jgi:hypothetical protein
MRKLIAALVLTAAPLAVAHAQDFTADGQTYHYVAKRQTNGSVHLTGNSDAGDAFDLVVRDRRVSGTMNRNPVEFSVSKQTAEAFQAEVGAQTASVN